MFVDREDAGNQLAQRLERFRSEHPLILALPRGGVVIGAAIAKRLACDLDVLLVKKLRAPGNPELALGALSEDGRSFINMDVAHMTRADESYLQREIKDRLAEINNQRALYRRVKPRVPMHGRVTILVDDGLATGATMMAAIQATALAGTLKMVAAVSVGPPETVRTLEAMPQLEEFICLSMPDVFDGVSQFYKNFTQVTDEEVVAVLRCKS